MEQSTSSPGTPTNEIKRSCRIWQIPLRVILEIFCLCLIFALLLFFVLCWPNLKLEIHSLMVEKTRLAPMSDGYGTWLKPPATTIRAYRLYNITNYMKIMTDPNNTVMTFQETDPFFYEVTVKKNNVEWLDNNTKIHYSVERIFTRHGVFDNALLNQEGAFIDILRVMFRTKTSRIAEKAFYLLGGNNAFNYSKAIDKLEGFVSSTFAAISSRMQGPNRDKYGFIYRYNGTNGFNYTIETDSKNSIMKGQMIDFTTEYTSYKTKSDDWTTAIFDGMTFPRLGNPPNRKVINVFQPDFCRPVQLRYNRTVSKFGFNQLHEFILKLVDVDKCPEMDEYCPESDRLDITKCISAELPPETVVLSKPHLYGHDSSYTNVDFKPEFDKHESRIYFEPITGTPIKAELRIQLNTNAWIDQLIHNADGSTDPTFTRALLRFVPMLWIDQTITVNENAIHRLRFISIIIDRAEKAFKFLDLSYIIYAFVILLVMLIIIELVLFHRPDTMSKSALYEPKKDQEKELLSPTNGTTTMKV